MQPAASALAQDSAAQSFSQTVGSPWYVCLTKPRQERFAQERLSEQGYEVFLPQLLSWQRRAGLWVRVDQVMFPRYAFVRPGRADQSIAPVRSTPGVSNMVHFGHVLGSLSASRLQALREVVNARAMATPAQPLKAGDLVAFSQGPLQGLAGLVSSVAAERVMVLMSLLGREKLVAVPAHQLSLA